MMIKAKFWPRGDSEFVVYMIPLENDCKLGVCPYVLLLVSYFVLRTLRVQKKMSL